MLKLALASCGSPTFYHHMFSWSTLSEPRSRYTLTQRHLTCFPQLVVLASLYLLIQKDFFQGPWQKHAICFALLCLMMQIFWLLHVSEIKTNLLSSHPPWHGSENCQVTRKATPRQVLGIFPAVATSFQRCHVDVTSGHVRLSSRLC